MHELVSKAVAVSNEKKPFTTKNQTHQIYDDVKNTAITVQ